VLKKVAAPDCSLDPTPLLGSLRETSKVLVGLQLREGSKRLARMQKREARRLARKVQRLSAVLVPK
jgi:hypothetical protein